MIYLTVGTEKSMLIYKKQNETSSKEQKIREWIKKLSYYTRGLAMCKKEYIS